MRKILLLSVFFIIFPLTAGIASAHRVGFGFGIFLAPPPILIGPPVVVAPPPVYYSPDEYYSRGYNERPVWVPGHWEMQETDRGRERVYVLGHWEYRP